MSILTLSQARLQLNYRDSSSTDDDDEIMDYLEGVDTVVERITGRVPVQREETEDFFASQRSFLVLRYIPVASLTSVETVDGSYVWDTSKLHTNERTGRVSVKDDERFFAGHVTVTYQTGYSTPPFNYNLAARIILQHLWTTQRGTSGAPRTGGMSDSIGVTGNPGFAYAIPNRALELLGHPMPGVA